MTPRLGAFFQPRDLMFLLTEIIPKSKKFLGGLKTLVEQTSIIYDSEINGLDIHNMFNILFFSGEFSFHDAYMKAWNVLHERSIQHDEELTMWLEFTSNMLHACKKYHMDIHSFSETWIMCPHWKDYLTRGNSMLLYWLLRSLAQFSSIQEEITVLIFETFPWDLSILRELSIQRSNDLSSYRECEYFKDFLHRDISSIWIYFLLSIPHTDTLHYYRKELLFSSSVKYKRYQDLLLQSWLDIIFISTKYQEQSYSNEDQEVAIMINTLKSNNISKDSNIMNMLSWVCKSLRFILDDPLLSISERLSLSLFNTKNMISVFVSSMSKHSVSSPLVSFAKSLCLANGIIFHSYSINHKNLPNQHFTYILKELNPSVYPSHREFLIHILESAADLVPWYFSSCKIPSNLAPIYYPSLIEYYISMLNILNNYPQYLAIFLNKFIIFHIITKSISIERLCTKCLFIISSLYNHIIERIDNDSHSFMDYIQERDLPNMSIYMNLFDKPFVKDMNLVSMIFKTLNLHCRMTSSVFPIEYIRLIPFSIILSKDDTNSIFNDIFMLLSTGKGVDWFLRIQNSNVHITLIGMLMEHCISSDNNYIWMSRVLQYIGYHESDQETLSWCHFHRYLNYNNLLSTESIHSLFIPALELVIKDPFTIISLFNDDENSCNLLLKVYLDKLNQSEHSILQPKLMYIVSLLYILSKRNDSIMMNNIVGQLSSWNSNNISISLIKPLKSDSVIEHSIRSILKEFKSIDDSENIIFQSIMQNISFPDNQVVNLLINIANNNPYFGFILCELQNCVKSDPILIHFGIMILYGLEICDIWTNESSRNACFEWFINNNESNKCYSLYFYLHKGLSIWNTSKTISSYCSRLYNGTMGMIDQLLLNIIQGKESKFEMVMTHLDFELVPLITLERLDIPMIQNTILYSRFDNHSILSGNKIYHPGYLLCFFYEFVKRFNRIDFEIWFPKFLNSYCLSFIIRCLSYDNEIACQCLDILYNALIVFEKSSLSQFRDIKWLIYYLSTAVDNKWPHIQASIYSHIAQVLIRFSNTFLYLECIDWITLYPRLNIFDAISLYERLFYSINNQINIFDSHSFRMFILESMISGIVTLQDVTMISRADKTIIDHILLWDLHSPLDFCQDLEIVDMLSQERVKIGSLLYRIVRTGDSQLLNLVLQWINTRLSINSRLSIYTWSTYLIYIAILEYCFNKKEKQYDNICIELFAKITIQMNDIITNESIKTITANDNPTVLNEIEQRYLQFLPRWWYLWNKCYDLLLDSNELNGELFSQHFNNLIKRMTRESYHHFYLETTGDELYLFIK